MSETNSFMDHNVRHVVRLFSEANGGDELDVRLTPAQAVLVYWALYMFSNAIGGSVRSLIVNSDYPDRLRGHANLVCWVNALRAGLVNYAHKNKVEVSVCD